MAEIVLITGASSGLGREFFRAVCATQKPDEIWLIARRETELNATAALCPEQKTVILPTDLSDPSGVEAILNRIREEKATVKGLINNAGYGILGKFEDADRARTVGMIDVNLRAPIALAQGILPYMKKGSYLINIASIAAFAPSPNLAVYSATKDFMYEFSLCLRHELRPRGICVHAVCPGPMATGFLPTAGITKENSVAFAKLPYCSPERIANKALRRAVAGKATTVDRGIYRFYRILAKVLPHSFLIRFTKA